jgi:hypothetical protein
MSCAIKTGRSDSMPPLAAGRYQYEIKPGVMRDCTRADPEYVWGDEGPISESRASGTY